MPGGERNLGESLPPVCQDVVRYNWIPERKMVVLGNQSEDTEAGGAEPGWAKLGHIHFMKQFCLYIYLYIYTYTYVCIYICLHVYLYILYSYAYLFYIIIYF